MPYFDRIRQLAAARGTPARRAVWGLEVDEFRPATAATARVRSAAAAGTTPTPAAHVSAPTPARAQPAVTLAPSAHDQPAAATAALAPPVAVPTLVQRTATLAPTVLDQPAAVTAQSEPADTREPDQRAAPLVHAHSETPRLARDPTPPPLDAPPPPAASPEPAFAPPGTPTRPEAVAQAQITALPDPAERAHRALAEVRRWIEEPPSRPRPRARHAATASAVAGEPGLSIGTIEVTVEEAPAPRPSHAVAPPPPPPRRAGRDVVPRDYLRGW